jgi:hypothetical protein
LTTPAKTNGVSRESLFTSSTPEAVTPQRGVPEATGPVSLPEERPVASKNLGEIKDETYNPASSGGVSATMSAAAARVSNAIPMTQDDLRAQLEEAKATIARLTTQASEASGLRQRKTESTQASGSQLSTTAHTPTAPAGGVSVQITALLCLMSFLVAYFLF